MREEANHQETKGNKFDYRNIKRLVKYIRPYRMYFVLLTIAMFVAAVLAPALPILIQRTIDDTIAVGDYKQLTYMLGLMLGVLALQALFQLINTYLSGWLGQNIIRDIRIELFRHVLSLRLKFYDRTPIGRLVTRCINDIETLAEVFSQGLASLVAELLQLVAILIAMFVLDWRLTLVSLSILPLLLISTYVFKEKVKSSYNEVRSAVSNLNTFVQERLSGMSVVQLFNTEEREYKRFEKINKEHRDANLRSVKYYSVYFPVAEVIGAMGIGFIVWFGGRGIMEGYVSGPGELIMFIMFLNMFFRPIRLIADRFNTLQMGLISTERIARLLDSTEVIEKEGTHAPASVKGDITFSNVWLAYENDDYVLKDISFDVKEGQTIAFVGATGAGKSSVVNLLNRYYDIQKGKITVDDVDVRDYQLQNLRSHIGVVLQDVFLFSDTIRENITLGNDTIGDQQIWDAARMIGAHRFIEKLPGGLDYNVKERGLSLSVGQRQLISFVRAMVYNPRIIVLDEATSSVDTETEQLIQEAIDKLMHGRTSIVIAHRLSTIQKADKIVVLDKGEIKESGSHEELLEKKGFYHKLVQVQYKAEKAIK